MCIRDRIICFAITKEQQNAIEVATALNNAFLCPSQEELYVSALMRKGYFTDSAYTVVNAVSYTHLDVYKRQILCRQPLREAVS